MPANPGIDDGGSCPLNGLAQRHDLIPGLATLDQVQHGQPVDNDEFRPNSFAHTADNLHGQAHTVLVRATPLVRSLVGPLTQKLVDEIAFGAHHLDAIITRKFGELRGTDEIVDLTFNPFRGKGAGLERADRRFGCRRRDNQRLVAITPCVQDLHTDLAACLMHRTGHMTMQKSRCPIVHGRGKRGQLPNQIGRETARHHEPHATFCALGKVPRELVDVPEPVFQARVHGPHQHSVLKFSEAEIQGFQKVGIGVAHGTLSINIYREYTLDQWQVDLTFQTGHVSSAIKFH